MEKILMIESKSSVASVLTFALNREGYQVVETRDGRTGLQAMRTQNPALILIDLTGPEMSSFDLLRQLQEENCLIPVILFVTQLEEADAVHEFKLQRNDYIVKPYDVRELLKRVKVHIRRERLSGSNVSNTTQCQIVGRFIIDPAQKTVTRDNILLGFGQLDYALFYFFATHAEQVFSREELLRQVWGYTGYLGDTRSVDVAVRRLRTKIEDDPSHPTCILTKRNHGYLFTIHPV